MFGIGTMARVLGEVRRDVAAAHARDPAARGVGSVEILASWPGVQPCCEARSVYSSYSLLIVLMSVSVSFFVGHESTLRLSAVGWVPRRLDPKVRPPA